MADKKKTKKEEKNSKVIKAKPKKEIKTFKEPKYSLNELCNILSISRYDAKAKFLIHGLDEDQKITVKKFRSFFKI